MATSRIRVVGALGVAQTLGWGSTNYPPAILAAPMARESGSVPCSPLGSGDGAPVGRCCRADSGAPASAVFAGLHGAGNGILTIAMGTLPLAIFGAPGYGLRQGLLMMPARFGQAGAPLFVALLIERWGGAALLLSAMLSLFSMAALLTLRAPSKAVHA